MSEKAKIERDDESFITVKTVSTTPVRMFTGSYKGFITTLMADPTNTGSIYIGKGAQSCTYPLAKRDAIDTKIDLDKLFYYSDNGTEKLHIWAEKDK